MQTFRRLSSAIRSLALAITLMAVCTSSNAADVFKVFGDGDFLIVPAEIESKACLLVVDTGCSTTTFDERLLHTAPRQIDRIATPSGSTLSRTFDVPTCQVGKFMLKDELEQVAGLDVTRIRRASGLQIDGCLGMDFLHKHVVRINFDEGILEIDASVPTRSDSTPIDLRLNERGWPCVRGSLGNENEYETEFVVDTGYVSFCSGLLEPRLCQYAEQLGVLHAIGSGSFVDVGHSGMTAVFKATALTFAGHSLNDPIFQKGEFNYLGLFYLSRFAVTFDFPNNKLYLTPGKAINKSDSRNLGGMGLIRHGKTVVIDSIIPGSPAESAGLNVDDEILSLDHLDALNSRIYQLLFRMSRCGTMEVTARRDGKEFKTVMTIK